MIDDEIEDEPDSAGVALLDELVHIGDGSVGRVDRLVVRDIVAHVDLGRIVHGREPDGVDAERLDVVEALDDALDVAHAVIVAVAEGSGPDLVDDGIAEPEGPRAGADHRVVGRHFRWEEGVGKDSERDGRKRVESISGKR